MINSLISLHPNWSFGFIAIISLIIGSFLNVVIYRMPITLFTENSSVNLWIPRSFCPHCKEQIPAWHNIPLISYIILNGKCHHCRKPISLKYPLVEGLTLLCSLLVAYTLGLTPILLGALPFTWIIICLAFIDSEHQILPDALTLSLLWLGLILNAIYPMISLQNAVLSAAGGYLVLWIFMKLFYLVTGKIGMGHGDFKLFSAFGAWFGWTQLPMIIMMSSIPFGPFLCISGFISLLYGDKILSWYLNII